MLSSEERHKANRRLAELCGLKKALNDDDEWFGDWTTAENRIVRVDFYEDSPHGAFWRERAIDALLKRIRVSFGSRAGFSIHRKQEAYVAEVFTASNSFIADSDGDFAEIHFAVNAAILNALDTLEA